MNVTAAHLDTDTTLDRATSGAGAPHTFGVDISLAVAWKHERRLAPLTAVYWVDGAAVQAFVTDQPLAVPAPAQFAATAQRCRAAIVDLNQPLLLVPVRIEKPWGAEVWYTGSDARAVSGVTDGRHITPFPWIVACAPRRICQGKPVPLLKILDPSPAPALGDLYFELHDVKEEVYFVTHVDRTAWPNGRGAVRYGVNPMRRARYGDDAKFRTDFLASVRAYRKTRCAIDALLDDKRRTAGIGLDDAVPATCTQRWLAELDQSLIDEERRRREHMDAFTNVRHVVEGDVVRVPKLLPHALQHGVRVIELQTPVFERRIISFAQKVLTQNHWDSEEAILRMRLDCPRETRPERVTSRSGCSVESIATIDGIRVQRVRLSPGAALTMPEAGAATLGIAVSGELRIDATTLAAESACLLPSAIQPRTLRNAGTVEAVALLAGGAP